VIIIEGKDEVEKYLESVDENDDDLPAWSMVHAWDGRILDDNRGPDGIRLVPRRCEWNEIVVDEEVGPNGVGVWIFDGNNIPIPTDLRRETNVEPDKTWLWSYMTGIHIETTTLEDGEKFRIDIGFAVHTVGPALDIAPEVAQWYIRASRGNNTASLRVAVQIRDSQLLRSFAPRAVESSRVLRITVGGVFQAGSVFALLGGAIEVIGYAKEGKEQSAWFTAGMTVAGIVIAGVVLAAFFPVGATATLLSLILKFLTSVAISWIFAKLTKYGVQFLDAPKHELKPIPRISSEQLRQDFEQNLARNPNPAGLVDNTRVVEDRRLERHNYPYNNLILNSPSGANNNFRNAPPVVRDDAGFFPSKKGMILTCATYTAQGYIEGFTRVTVKDVYRMGTGISITYSTEVLKPDKTPLMAELPAVERTIIFENNNTEIDFVNMLFGVMPVGIDVNTTIPGGKILLPANLSPGQKFEDLDIDLNISADMATVMKGMGIEDEQSQRKWPNRIEMTAKVVITDRKCVARESLMTQAGIFNDAYKVSYREEMTINMMGVTQTQVTTAVSWNVRGIGAIRTVTHDSNGTLISATDLYELIK
jgi:hypothetical protein